MRGCERRWEGPSFPTSAAERRRVVVEGGDAAERWIIARAVSEAGLDVARCDGPIENGGPCPLVAGRGCAAVESADVVVNLLGLGSPGGADVLRAVRTAAPHTPILAQATPFDRERLASLVAECGCQVVSPRASVTAITDAVRHAAAVPQDEASA